MKREKPWLDRPAIAVDDDGIPKARLYRWMRLDRRLESIEEQAERYKKKAAEKFKDALAQNVGRKREEREKRELAIAQAKRAIRDADSAWRTSQW